MQDKQKVTLYLPPELHKQLKVQAALDAETMTQIAQRAIEFYLHHSDVVEQCEAMHGQTHRVYGCPECSSSVVLREGQLVSLNQPSATLNESDELLVGPTEVGVMEAAPSGEGELMSCVGSV